MDEPTPVKMTTTPEAPKPFKEWEKSLTFERRKEIVSGIKHGSFYTERMAEAYNAYVFSFIRPGMWDYNNGFNDGYFKGIADANKGIITKTESMNKIQYIELLKLRGVTELKGESIADAIRRTGGEPTLQERADMNYNAMQYFAEHHGKAVGDAWAAGEKLKSANATIEKRDAEILRQSEKIAQIEQQLKQQCPDAADLNELEDLREWKNAMLVCGVDNWPGYSYAMEIYGK